MLRLPSICFFLSLLAVCHASSECFWAIGRVQCEMDQSKVVHTVIEIWDKDGPKTEKAELKLFNKSVVLSNKLLGAIDSLDHDDKAGITVVEHEDGYFKVEGCASDQDWFGYRNTPEFYFRIRHRCTSDGSEKMFEILPPVKVFAPNTFDKYMEESIMLV